MLQRINAPDSSGAQTMDHEPMRYALMSTLLAGLMLSSPLLAQAPAPAQTPPPVLEEKRVCRAQLETGSLIKKRKTCHTVKQWRYIDEAHNDEARRMQLENTGGQSGN